MNKNKGLSKNHHDAYFKQVFSKTENITDLPQGTLPKLSEKLALDTLKLDNNSYINKELTSEYSDLVYNCNYGNENIKIALLFEHKSKQEANIEMQLGSYIWRFSRVSSSRLF